MRLRILVSFYYYKNTNMDRLVSRFPEPPEIFVDSGGFSAYTQGAAISLDDYAAWLQRWAHLWTAYANLDAIGNPAKTLDNQRALEARGLAPLPVFHCGSPMSYLHDYMDQYPYIALGGMVPFANAPVLRWAARCFKDARPSGTVFHGFGQTSVDMLRALPWYSVDSSSWGGGHRYGRLQLWDHKQVKFTGANVGNRAEVYANADLIRAHGGDPAMFITKGFGTIGKNGKSKDQARDERGQIIAVNVAAWLHCEAWMRAHHGPVGPPNAQGPKLYLASTSPPDVTTAGIKAGPLVYLAMSLGDTGNKEHPDGQAVARAVHHLHEQGADL